MANNQTAIVKDLPNKKLTVTREFDAAPEDVWRAWTESELLDQWWAPLPWKTRTDSMNFANGGSWLYTMVGPEGEKNRIRIDFSDIDTPKSFKATSFFCDEQGAISNDVPATYWKNSFYPAGEKTKVIAELSFDSEKDLAWIIEMGFEAGFKAALGNLDEYFAAKFKLRGQLRTNNAARVTTYLNFDGKTEEAFNFYRKVFGTEFSGRGIQRLGDIPAESGQPPVAENLKKMILHVELPTLGGHILMGTDAPKEMGFVLTQGDNMHICLEPATREETKRLFDELSAGGNITMELKDMFFGAYYGSFTDKFGINWMVNHYNT